MIEKYCLRVINGGNIPDGHGVSLLPREGLEPTLLCRKRILSPPRLPFRHLGLIIDTQEGGGRIRTAASGFCRPLP